MILSELYLAYDGAIPVDQHACAQHGGYAVWQKHIARAAERQFYRLVMQTIEHLQFWRMRPHSLWARRSLTLYSLYLQNHRKKACEAYLLGENAVYF